MGPDEYRYPVNNSVFTNVVAKNALLLPRFAGDLAGISVPDHYKQVADKMRIPFDKEKQYHPEYDGYTQGRRTLFFPYGHCFTVHVVNYYI